MYYNSDTIATCASGLVGWQQGFDASLFTLSAQNLQSTSGYYVDNLPGVELAKITEMISTNEADMNAYLQRVITSETTRLVNRAVDRIKDKLNTKELLSNFDPISGVANFTDKVTQDARFVGYYIMPNESENLRAEITHVGMQIDTLQVNPLKIYLYDTSQKEAIATYDYTNTKDYSLEWKAVSDFIINYRSSSSGTGQSFLLGYYEADTANAQTSQLEGQALFIELGDGCEYTAKRRRRYEKYIGVSLIELPNSMLNWNGLTYDLPDTEHLENYQVTNTSGLMIKFNITCDISHVICMNKDIFAEPLQYAIAVRVLGDSLSNYKLNATTNAKFSRDEVRDWMLKYQADLMGYNTEQGWRKGMIDRLVLDISNLDQFCLPCQKNKPFMGRVNRGH